MFTKFAGYKVPPVMVSTHGSVVPLAMFFSFCFYFCRHTSKGYKVFVYQFKFNVCSIWKQPASYIKNVLFKRSVYPMTFKVLHPWPRLACGWVHPLPDHGERQPESEDPGRPQPWVFCQPVDNDGVQVRPFEVNTFSRKVNSRLTFASHGQQVNN